MFHANYRWLNFSLDDSIFTASDRVLIFSISTDIEVSNRHGHTCLMIACYKGHYKIANFLLALKADINKKSVKGNTALHDCAESGSLDIFKMLILNGAKMEVDSYG